MEEQVGLFGEPITPLYTGATYNRFMSMKEKILKTLKKMNGEWIYGYELHGMTTDYGKLGSSAERRARELHEEGKLERRKFNGKAQYRYYLS